MTTPFDESKKNHGNDELDNLEPAVGDESSPSETDDGIFALSEDGLDGIPESDDYAVVKETQSPSEDDENVAAHEDEDVADALPDEDSLVEPKESTTEAEDEESSQDEGEASTCATDEDVAEDAEASDDSPERDEGSEPKTEPEAEAAESESFEDEDKEGESAEGEVEEHAEGEAAPVGETSPKLGDIEILKVHLSADDEPVSLAELIPDGDDEPIGETIARALTLSLHFIREGKVSLDEEAPAETQVSDMWASISEEFPGISAPDDGTSASPAIQIDTGEEEDSSNGVSVARTRVRKEKPIWGELIKIVLGGIVGLAIGYYLINFLFGARCDVLKVPLPGVPHTYTHCPDWWPDWLKWGAPKESGRLSDASDKGRFGF
ncbi:hypothetical protein JCM19992_19490 [Thermostilla marina]